MMDADDTITSIDKIQAKWEKKIGLVYSFIALSIVYYALCNVFDSNYSIYKIYNLILPFLYLALVVIWGISTNRVPIKRSNQLGVYVSISCDEDCERKIKVLFSSIVEQINRERDLNLLHVKLLPINRFKTTSESEDWVNTKGDETTIIFLDIKNGNVNSEEKINIASVSYTGYFRKNNIIINDSENFNIVKDLALRVDGKDWSYFEKNSLADKDKLRANLKDLIVYYAGVYSLNQSKFENARLLLKYLYQPKSTEIESKVDMTDTKKVHLRISQKNIQAARLNYLLANLYLNSISNRLNQNNLGEAITLLKEIETYEIDILFKIKVYINSSLAFYLQGNIPEAKKYTEKLHEISPQSFAYAINMGFFAMIENDHLNFVKYYSLINEAAPIDSEPVYIIAFLDEHMNNYPNSILLFEMADAVLTKLFIDENEGNTKLSAQLQNIPSTHQFKSLRRFCEQKLKYRKPKKVVRKQAKQKRRAKKHH
jgi:tetratricopeptide (TPR) repeat protein